MLQTTGPTHCVFSLAEGRLKSHNVMTAESESQQKALGECWSDLEVYQIIQAVFSKGVPLGNIDGKAGLLILEKLLICSLLALRTLITPIVVLVPLRPEWMSLLRNSFLLPSKWRRSHQKRPYTQSETSACQQTSYSICFHPRFLHLMSGLLFG